MTAAVVVATAVTSMASMASSRMSRGQEYRQITSKWAGLTACLYFFYPTSKIYRQFASIAKYAQKSKVTSNIAFTYEFYSPFACINDYICKTSKISMQFYPQCMYSASLFYSFSTVEEIQLTSHAPTLMNMCEAL